MASIDGREPSLAACHCTSTNVFILCYFTRQIKFHHLLLLSYRRIYLLFVRSHDSWLEGEGGAGSAPCKSAIASQRDLGVLRPFCRTVPHKFRNPKFWTVFFSGSEHCLASLFIATVGLRATRDHKTTSKQNSKSTSRRTHFLLTYLLFILVWTAESVKRKDVRVRPAQSNMGPHVCKPGTTLHVAEAIYTRPRTKP